MTHYDTRTFLSLSYPFNVWKSSNEESPRRNNWKLLHVTESFVEQIYFQFRVSSRNIIFHVHLWPTLNIKSRNRARS